MCLPFSPPPLLKKNTPKIKETTSHAVKLIQYPQTKALAGSIKCHHSDLMFPF